MLLRKIKTNPQQAELYEALSEKYQKAQAENRELKTLLTALPNLSALTNEGYQIIGLTEKHNVYYVAAATHPTSHHNERQDIYLFQLPNTHLISKLGHMQIIFQSSCQVYLEDWHVRPVNHGLGSIFLNMVITHFTNTGFQSIYGYLSFVDDDHMDLLLHLYKKFNFSITEKNGKKMIHLNLLENPRCPVCSMDHEVCIRTPTYSVKKYVQEIFTDQK